jgi:hypothetical protein
MQCLSIISEDNPEACAKISKNKEAIFAFLLVGKRKFFKVKVFFQI